MKKKKILKTEILLEGTTVFYRATNRLNPEDESSSGYKSISHSC